MTLFADPQSTPYARVAGGLYMVIAVAGIFSIGYLPSIVMIPGDPEATVGAILANRGLFGLGLVGEAVVMLAEIMLTAMLYFMFRPVSPVLSLAAALARLLMVAVMAAMLFFTALALFMIEGSAGLAAFTVEQREALAFLFLRGHDSGVIIWQLFFALHLVLLGWLVLRSGAFPRVLGVLMMIGALGYVMDSIGSVGIIDSPGLTYLTYALLALVAVGEVGFALWLLIRGPGPFRYRLENRQADGALG